MKHAVIIVLFLICISFNVSSQSTKFSYGFYIELIQRSNQIKTNTILFESIESQNKLGYGLGLNLFFELKKDFSLRISPGACLEEEILLYTYPNSSSFRGLDKLKRGSTSLKLPVHVLWNFIPSMQNIGVVTGLTPIIGILGGNDSNNDLNFNRLDLTGDIGLSYSIKINNLFIRPEIKYSKSFIDGKVSGLSIYQEAIESYSRDRFTFTLIFL